MQLRTAVLEREEERTREKVTRLLCHHRPLRLGREDTNLCISLHKKKKRETCPAEVAADLAAVDENRATGVGCSPEEGDRCQLATLASPRSVTVLSVVNPKPPSALPVGPRQLLASFLCFHLRLFWLKLPALLWLRFGRDRKRRSSNGKWRVRDGCDHQPTRWAIKNGDARQEKGNSSSCFD